MPLLVLSEELAEQILDDYEARTGRRFDEVWDGVNYIMPEPDNEHYDLSAFFVWAFRSVFDPAKGDRVGGPANVSDRRRDWKRNYRVPDFSVFLAGNPAEDHGSHWFGGPDLALEIVSPDDQSRAKLEFYARVGTREVLILDRNPWRLEQYQLRRARMRRKAAIIPGDGKVLASTVVPMSFQLLRSRHRPKVKIVHAGSGQEWVG